MVRVGVRVKVRVRVRARVTKQDQITPNREDKTGQDKNKIKQPHTRAEDGG